MIDRLRAHYGELLLVTRDGDKYFSFPALLTLAQASEEDLRALGLGYRAKYVIGTAQRLQVR